MNSKKKILIDQLKVLSVIILLLTTTVEGQSSKELSMNIVEPTTKDWEPANSPILTKWVKDVNPKSPWNNYPRPQLKRERWQSLNGLWKYDITNDNANNAKPKFENNILVPFPIESALSGVGKKISPEETLWYQTLFTIPDEWNEQNKILHFGAVDWEASIWVNDEFVGHHKGGYDPFFFDITKYLRVGENNLKVAVKDPTDTGNQPVGKQVLNPEGIFYTSVTGIWQTVWIEPVSNMYLESFKCITDIDNKEIIIYPKLNHSNSMTEVKVEVLWKGELVNSIRTKQKDKIHLKISNPRLWTPSTPNLYDLNISIIDNDNVVDRVESYMGMRKISINKADDGFVRIFLNNKPLFQNGPLDQGYWPDGLYTPPTDEAMKHEVQLIKNIGFNMLRKHVKIEPDRFYYWCDRIGILVWQDMPNGDKKIGPNDPDIVRTSESEKQFEYELTQLINTHYNHPSIIMWIPFNEGWGQYKTAEVVNYVKKLDPTRLVNNASGWTDRGVGDVNDIHHYPNPKSPEPEKNRAVVLGEFGGLGLYVEDHVWQTDDNWGYSIISDSEKLTGKYEEYYSSIWELSKKGLSACVYTQITDVETETNGLLTYDREILKIDAARLKKINTGNYIPAPMISPDQVLLNKGSSITISSNYQGEIRYTTDGSIPDQNSKIYKAPIIFNSDMIVTAIVCSDDDQSRLRKSEFKFTDIIEPNYKYSYSSKYSAGGTFALLDGELGSNNYGDGKWQGFEGVDLDVILDLGKLKKINTVKINFLQAIKSWIFFPENLTISTSTDGENYSEIENIIIPVAKDIKPDSIKTFSATMNNHRARYIRVKAVNIEECPQWHPGAGGKVWIFVDEIKIE